MKKGFFVLLLLSVTLNIKAQSYLGLTKRVVNFRTGPSMSSEKIASLDKDTRMFIFSKELFNDYFYHVMDIETNEEGYIHSSYIELGDLIPEKNELFKRFGRTMSPNSNIRIHNDSDLTLTLVLNEEIHTFAPQEKTVLDLSPRLYTFRVQAKGIIPIYGSQMIESRAEYIWKFTTEE